MSNKGLIVVMIAALAAIIWFKQSDRNQAKVVKPAMVQSSQISTSTPASVEPPVVSVPMEPMEKIASDTTVNDTEAKQPTKDEPFVDPNSQILADEKARLEHQKELDEMAAFQATGRQAPAQTAITYPSRPVN